MFFRNCFALVFVVFLIGCSSKTDPDIYFSEIPERYAVQLQKIDEKTEEFFCAVIEEHGRRELFILKPNPTQDELNAKFVIKVFSSQNSEKELAVKFDLAKIGYQYNFNNTPCAFYRAALPFIEIDSVIVERKVENKWQLKYRQNLNKPFKSNLFSPIEIGDNLGFKTEPNPYRPVLYSEFRRSGITFIPYKYASVKGNLVQTMQPYKDFVTEQNKTVGIVKKPNAFWKHLNDHNPKLEALIQFTGSNSEKAQKLVSDYLSRKKDVNDVFDLEYTANFYAITELFGASCSDYTYFEYVEDVNLIRPIFVNSNCLGKHTKFLKKPIINNNIFNQFYLSALNDITTIDIQEELINSNTRLENELHLINSKNPDVIFDPDVLYLNQRVINHNINSAHAIRPDLISIDKSKLIITVHNTSNFPIAVSSLSHEGKKDITALSSRYIVRSGDKDTITFELPRSFENLFVSKKNKEIGFKLHKHIYELFVRYNTLETDQQYYTAIRPYKKYEQIEVDLFREQIKLELNKDLIVSEKDKTIGFKEKLVTLNSAIVIPKGYTFKVSPGTTIDIVEGGKIITHSPVAFMGNLEAPITFTSSDKKGQGLLVLSEGLKNEVNHTTFEYLTNLTHGLWDVSGAVSFYESPVILNYVTVSHNSCEDALNIIRTSFEMHNSIISYTQSDAFDGDFVTGLIKDSDFINLGNDGIDVSGSELIIENVKVLKAGDKGLSAGEDSKMFINTVVVEDSEIAVAGKDLSEVEAKNLTVKNTKLGFTAFQKKPEFAPSNIVLDNVSFTNVEIDYLIESSSSLMVDGEIIETSDNVKERMYGAEFGVSSDETRNKKNN